MANDPVSVRLSQRDKTDLNDLAEDEGFGESKALERAARKGLDELGYGIGASGPTRLQRWSREMWRACLWIAAAMLGMHAMSPTVALTGPAVVFLVIAIIANQIAYHEPRLSRWAGIGRHGQAVADGGGEGGD